MRTVIGHGLVDPKWEVKTFLENFSILISKNKFFMKRLRDFHEFFNFFIKKVLVNYTVIKSKGNQVKIPEPSKKKKFFFL